MRALLLCALAACGDNALGVDAAVPDAAIRCAATFRGNFDASSTLDTCATATLDDRGRATLALAIPTSALDEPWTAQIDLGPLPASGRYVSSGVATWRASGVHRIGNGVCFYNAGTAAVPTGSFALTLDSVDVATTEVHGALAVVQYVLAYPSTDCGDADTEMIDVRF